MRHLFDLIAAGTNYISDVTEAYSEAVLDGLIDAAPSVLGLGQEILSGLKSSSKLKAAVQRYGSYKPSEEKLEEVANAYAGFGNLIKEIGKEFDNLGKKPSKKLSHVSAVN